MFSIIMCPFYYFHKTCFRSPWGPIDPLWGRGSMQPGSPTWGEEWEGPECCPLSNTGKHREMKSKFRLTEAVAGLCAELQVLHLIWQEMWQLALSNADCIPGTYLSEHATGIHWLPTFNPTLDRDIVRTKFYFNTQGHENNITWALGLPFSV